MSQSYCLLNRRIPGYIHRQALPHRNAARAPIKVEASLGAVGKSQKLRLSFGECHVIDVGAKTQTMPALHHAQVGDILMLRILPVIRHEVIGDTQSCEVIPLIELELRPAAFKRSRSVSSGNSQNVGPDLLPQPRLFRSRSLAGPAIVGVQHHGRRERISSHHREPEGVPMPVPGVTAAANRISA